MFLHHAAAIYIIGNYFSLQQDLLFANFGGIPSHPSGESLLERYKKSPYDMSYKICLTMLKHEIRLWPMPCGFAICTGQVWVDSYTIWYLLATTPAISYDLRVFFWGKMGLPENQIFNFLKLYSWRVWRILSILNYLGQKYLGITMHAALCMQCFICHKILLS